ncbi:Sec-independent protein translocase protein TatB [Enterovirga sp.]|uniref:Sec-independent protein translocase protein TatB n=1 Tax=Enterovirga sp. TaxID=2026350 RepID=UPI002BFDA640|nr:Sec-independent protein translocase protein TatB [Enterovirga sp.]HMO28223.1 Sec-independent protein translocase protein TatB [Enterovirga sp.]
MFDMSWGEVMVIGGVALIVIGPKDLPKALRTVGQMTAKVRRLAGEFRTQFSEAMREADLEDIKKEMEGFGREVGSTASGVSGFNPIQTIRDELKGAVEGTPSGAPAAVDLPATPEPATEIPLAVREEKSGWSEYGPGEPPGQESAGPLDAGTLNPGFINPEVQPPLPAEELLHPRKADPAPQAPEERHA